MIHFWPDLIAWIVLVAAGLWVLSFLWMSMMFTEVGEKILGVLAWVVPIAAVSWAIWTVTT